MNPRFATARAAKTLNEQFIPAMQQWQAEIEGLWSAIEPSPQEDGMLEGEVEEDEATEMRALLECLGRQQVNRVDPLGGLPRVLRLARFFSHSTLPSDTWRVLCRCP